MASPPQTSPTAPQIRTTTTEQTGIHYSTIYLHTVPGTLKCICLVIFSIFSFHFHFQIFLVFCVENEIIYLNQNVFRLQVFALVGFILVQCSQHSGSGRAQFFSTIAMIAFWFSGILLVLYLFHVIYVFSKIPWTKIEFFFCLGACLLLALSSAILIAQGIGLFTAAGVSQILFNCAKVKWDLDEHKWISLQHNELTLEKKVKV